MRLENIINWIEHFCIIPIRWYGLQYHAWNNLQQRCKVCGCIDKFNYNVPDDVWLNVIPPKYQNRVVCLACFDNFAEKMEVDYSTSIKEICFAGCKVSLQFQRN